MFHLFFSVQHNNNCNNNYYHNYWSSVYYFPDTTESALNLLAHHKFMGSNAYYNLEIEHP